jgi:RNA polymerase sigma factor (sigma-70 family)
MGEKNDDPKNDLPEAIREDIERARRICDELIAGNKRAIEELVFKYSDHFKRFAQSRLSKEAEIDWEDVLSDFWVQLLDGRIICDFLNDPKTQTGRKSSLKWYLMCILSRRIIDAIRSRERRRNKNEAYRENQEIISGDTERNPDDILLQKEKKMLIKRALILLSESDPIAARRIRMHFFDGKTHSEIARQELGKPNPGADELRKKEQAIRKQFTRKGSGHIAQLKIAFQRVST